MKSTLHKIIDARANKYNKMGLEGHKWKIEDTIYNGVVAAGEELRKITECAERTVFK